jgi:hypothetical protein
MVFNCNFSIFGAGSTVHIHPSNNISESSVGHRIEKTGGLEISVGVIPSYNVFVCEGCVGDRIELSNSKH